MDHAGAYYMAMAILLALIHRQRTGEGQWVDLACSESALTLHGPALLDRTVNGRPARRDGQPHANRHAWPPMAPHGIYPCRGDDDWVAIRTIVYPGAPYAMPGSPWSISRRAPKLGEHDVEVFEELAKSVDTPP